MLWTSKEVLALVELIIYISLTPAIPYTLYKHKGPSVIGHIYLFIFVSLRIIASVLTISHRSDPSSNTTGMIINSIGLSPLLLASAGFIGEARYYIFNHAQNRVAKRAGLVTEAVLHGLVIVGVALLAIGSANAATATIASDINNYRAQAYSGAVLLLAAWIVICVWALWTLKESNSQKREGRYHRLARLLLVEVIISLPFTGIRVCYGMVYTFDHSPDLSPATSSFAVAFILVFLVQLISASIIILGLVVTRTIRATSIGEHGHGERDGCFPTEQADK